MQNSQISKRKPGDFTLAYISTGAKSGYYTLWTSDGYNEQYHARLSTDSEKAQARAEQICKRIGCDLMNSADFPLEPFDRNSRAEQRVEQYNAAKEDRIVTFGKYAGTSFDELPVDYVKWLATVDGASKPAIAAIVDLAKETVDSLPVEILDKVSEFQGRLAAKSLWRQR